MSAAAAAAADDVVGGWQAEARRGEPSQAAKAAALVPWVAPLVAAHPGLSASKLPSEWRLDCPEAGGSNDVVQQAFRLAARDGRITEVEEIGGRKTLSYFPVVATAPSSDGSA